jgi:hypothetical protein
MTKKLLLILLCVFCLGILCAAADDDDNNNNGDIVLKARLIGLNEGPPNNTTATGTFTATIPADGSPITFTLTFDGLTGGNPSQAHIHFGFPKGMNGGVMIFLCGGPLPTPCPAATSGTVTGTITGANVVGPAGQGVNPGDLDTALRLVVEDGAGYANIHNSKFPGGEIRGQVHVRHHHDD